MYELREYCAAIFAEHSGKLLRYLRRLGGGANSEDILQEVFIRFIREVQHDRIQKGSELRWLYRASRNLAIDYYRKDRKNTPWTDDRIAATGEGEGKIVLGSELVSRMFDVARKCGPDYETLLHLILETRESQSSMAAILKCSERTVRRRTETLFGALERGLPDWRDYLET
ncbi:MAG TPA: sigma-70 family RNA polymerase sigma factor [Leptospiraceae bacterium]|nr:sigma-70 family RNA polymerase sigma factor [Leptospirales bacterium]HMX57138.1 sigma-70 family RNA polymerase sigma factor [Leptospiraceae bacterium]HMZ36911.1 sigma-70 family RNA polymerase sigma factor [Leptospiraceae bacterium]HNE22097.1 sigma-70 family RNA polymerase sigma factor [Leptospiraceae bacterium]HNJ33222.1 sigma-70 family RNA polymerase sigma factor [Leptospiraceae bacterium]